ncbi:MAG: DUF624 domain-containing protein [Clostridia bacterium]|nr:DUF624 domain-containing protein [Clostridia bacterium]
MGIFSHSYDKPGPGVDPNAPQKRSFFRFFEIFWRKFSKFFQVGLIYSLFLIPTFIIMFMVSTVVVGRLAEAVGIFELEEMTTIFLLGGLAFVNLLIAVLGAGPATAGITYVMLCFSKEEHTWVWSDFKDKVKENFKQATAVFVIDLLMTLLFYVAIIYYSGIGGMLGNLRYVVYFIILIYTMMHLYIYPLMVTFKLPLGAIYKNSLLFAIAKLPSNIFVLIVHLVIHVGLQALALFYGGRHSGVILMGLYLLEVVLLQAFSAYLTAFSTYPKMKKYMLDVAEGGNAPSGDEE